MRTLSLVYAFSTIDTRLRNCTRHQYRCLRPNSLYNLLTRCTFDKAFSFTHDSHFNCVSNTILEVLAILPSLTNYLWVSPRVDGPTCRQGQSQVPHAVTIFSQNTNCEDVADLCTASRERPGTYTLVSPKMNTVDQEAENNSLIPIPLYVSIFLLQWSNEGVGQIRSSELCEPFRWMPLHLIDISLTAS